MDDIRATLIGFYVFTRSDYVSSFFKRGKQACFKVIKQCNEFIDAFILLGEGSELNAELKVALEILYVIYTDTKIQITTKSERNYLTKSL